MTVTQGFVLMLLQKHTASVDTRLVDMLCEGGTEDKTMVMIMQLGFLPFWFTLQHFPSLLNYSNLTLHHLFSSVLHEGGFLLLPHSDCASASLCHAVWSVESQCVHSMLCGVSIVIRAATLAFFHRYSCTDLQPLPVYTPCRKVWLFWPGWMCVLGQQCRADPVGGKVLQSTLVSGSSVAPWLTNTSATFTLSSWAARWRGVSPLLNTQVQQM